ncbi:MAG: ABC transporter permease, partial [Phyllobacterium sp.]
MANSAIADIPIALKPVRQSGKLSERAIQWGMFAGTVILVAGPMVPLVFQALTDKPIYDSGHQLSLVNFYNVVSSELFREAAWNSIVFALLSTLVAQIVGTLQAILISRTNMPGRAAMTPIILLPLFLSPLVIAFGWSILYGRAGYATGLAAGLFGPQPWNLESMGGMVLVAGILQAPITFLYCRGAIALADQSMEDAARGCGAAPLTILRRITIPLLLPSIVFSGMINLTHALETLSIPLILGEPAEVTLLMPLLYKRALGSA